MPSECAAVGCSEKLTKKFSVHAFPLKKKKKKKKLRQKTTVANGNESMGPSHKEMGTKTPRCALLKAFRKKCFTDRTLLSIQFGLKYMSTG